MDKNNTIIDIRQYLESKTEDAKEEKKTTSFHSNPIFKKFLIINNKKTQHKFSLKDLFR